MKEAIKEQTRIFNEILLELEDIEKALNSKDETITVKDKQKDIAIYEVNKEDLKPYIMF